MLAEFGRQMCVQTSTKTIVGGDRMLMALFDIFHLINIISLLIDLSFGG